MCCSSCPSSTAANRQESHHLSNVRQFHSFNKPKQSMSQCKQYLKFCISMPRRSGVMAARLPGQVTHEAADLKHLDCKYNAATRTQTDAVITGADV